MRETLTIMLPLSDAQVKAVVLAAAPLGVEPWELAVYALEFKRTQQARIRAALAEPSGE